MPDGKSKLVYSTDRGIPRKEKPDEQDVQAGVPPSHQRVTVRLDRKGRGGKSVTVVEGLLMPLKEKEALLKQLKTRFGTGGTVTDAVLEIQGDHRDAVIEALKKIGYSPKRSGGVKVFFLLGSSLL
jgi:translation initiation factor 1